MAGETNKLEFEDEKIAVVGEELLKAGKLNLGKTQNKDTTTPPHTGGFTLKNLRTFQGDVAEAIKNQNASVFSVAMAEQKREAASEPKNWNKEVAPEKSGPMIERILGTRPIERPSLPVPPAPKPTPEPKPQKSQQVVFRTKQKNKFGPDFTKNLATIAASLLLIVLGIGAVAGFYLLQKEGPVSQKNNEDLALIPYDEIAPLTINDMEREELIEALSAFRTDNRITENQILFIPILKNVASSSQISTGEFLARLETEMPGSLARSLNNVFMFGMFKKESNKPFLVLRVNSFENAFDGMLRWEENLNEDLGSLFSNRALPITSYIPSQSGTSSVAGSSTPLTTIVNFDLDSSDNFKDVAIRNKDARVLRNFRGDTILLYSFLDERTLLITSDENILTDIINRLIAEKSVQ